MRIIRELTKMHPTIYVEQARDWTTRLEKKAADKHGVSLKDAREIVARETGTNPGTLENLRNGRLKAIAVHAYERLRHGVIRELEAEMRRYEHELQILRQTGADPRDFEIAEVEAGLARIREVLGR
jgi:hypothetical protein